MIITSARREVFEQFGEGTDNNLEMSRSLKKTPKKGITTAKSEKENKRTANRKLRRVTKIQVKKGNSEPANKKEVSNVWSFDKDGKQFLKNPTKKDLRK
jgi:hypothetical protein